MSSKMQELDYHSRIANARDCPYCLAKKGFLCYNVHTAINGGQGKPIRAAHQERGWPERPGCRNGYAPRPVPWELIAPR